MNTRICPTCGCSLVRLGVSNDPAVMYESNGKEYHFCCQACTDLFITDPQQYLRETSDLIVCPTCLAEKPRERAAQLQIAGQDVHFCRCPYCPDVFQKNPEYYMQRLAGTIPHQGVLDHERCCVRPV